MSLEAMVGGALRDMIPNDCQYVIGKLDSSGKFDCGFVPRFLFITDNYSDYYSFSFPKEGGNSSSYYYGGDSYNSYNFTLSGTVLDFSKVGVFKNIIAFK